VAPMQINLAQTAWRHGGQTAWRLPPFWMLLFLNRR